MGKTFESISVPINDAILFYTNVSWGILFILWTNIKLKLQTIKVHKWNRRGSIKCAVIIQCYMQEQLITVWLINWIQKSELVQTVPFSEKKNKKKTSCNTSLTIHTAGKVTGQGDNVASIFRDVDIKFGEIIPNLSVMWGVGGHGLYLPHVCCWPLGGLLSCGRCRCSGVHQGGQRWSTLKERVQSFLYTWALKIDIWRSDWGSVPLRNWHSSGWGTKALRCSLGARHGLAWSVLGEGRA